MQLHQEVGQQLHHCQNHHQQQQQQQQQELLLLSCLQAAVLAIASKQLG
jgi:hypothetical protein